MSTNIEWARNPDGSKGETWPVVTGCTPVSEGCRNCYAARMAATRLKLHPRYEGLAVFENGKARWTGEVRLNHDVLEQPLRWRKPRMVFIASMGDLFHEGVSLEFVDNVFNIMETADRHTFQILTKQPKRMLEYCQYHRPAGARGWMPPLSNVWLGVSVENQAAADERIPYLLQAPAAVRFVSVEPMLGPVDFDYASDTCHCGDYVKDHYAMGHSPVPMIDSYLHNGLDWVICGAESGPGARPMDEAWVRDLRDQCTASGVPFFYKQNVVNGKKVSLPFLDGRQWTDLPNLKTVV